MKKVLFQIVILALLAAICLSGYLFLSYVLGLPFRATNDALHQKKSAITLETPDGAEITFPMDQVADVLDAKPRSPGSAPK